MLPFFGTASAAPGAIFVPPPPDPDLDLLFTPFVLGGLTLPNRVVLPAMGTGFASDEGLPTARLIEWYAARAAGGVGLAIVENTRVLGPSTDVTAGRRRTHLSLANDAAVPAFERLVAAIHRGGARAAIQLSNPFVPDLAAVPGGEIAALVRAFGAAARRAREAGFDAIDLQCTYGSVLVQLLSPATNKRRDKYGRGPAGRLRSLLDVVAAVRAGAGDDVPLIVKLPADEYLPRGLTLEDTKAIAQALERAGAAALEVIAGAVASDADVRLSAGVGEATQADLAAAIKEAVSIPVIAEGRILTSSTADKTLRDGQAHLVAIGRAHLADPAWTAKVRAGIEDEAIPCIGCLACFTPAPDGGTGCPVNGEAGREYLPPLEPAVRPRRVTVLGASLAAMELARVAASRGHQVELVTAGLPLGGLLGYRAGVPGNAEYGRASISFGDRLVELGVGIEDGPAQHADVTADCRPPDEVQPAWTHGKGVMLAGELLGRDLHELYGIGRRVAVVGPGALAAEVALFLAGWGRRPTVVVPGSQDRPFPDVHPMHAARLRERLAGYKVPVVAEAEVLEWRYDENRKSALRVRRRGREDLLSPFHSAVSAAGWGAIRLWPAAAGGDPVPATVPDGTTFVLPDTPYPEPLRDLVAQAHLIGRAL
jgi:2,4-dienoyl-CoA reductase-like NADH-dependent reductase (Old Yellow Enzyme family)